MESANVVLDVWQTSDGDKTTFHAALGNNPSVSGGYHSVLERSKQIFADITHINRAGNIIPWSQRFV